MSFWARVVNVFIASPGDAGNERQALERSIEAWNRASRARRRGVVLLPQLYEIDARPTQGMPGQDVIEHQLLDETDVLIAVFRARLGSPTTSAASGTASEIDGARARGFPTHVFTYNGNISVNHDGEQLAALNRYKEKLSAAGLLGRYTSTKDLVQQVERVLDVHVSRLESLPRPIGLMASSPEPSALEKRDPRAASKVRERAEILISRNRPFAVKSLLTRVTLRRSDDARYLLYDFTSIATLNLTGPLEVALAIKVRPSPILRSSPEAFTQRTDPQRDPWETNFFPQVERIEDWPALLEKIDLSSVTVSAQNNPKAPPTAIKIHKVPISGGTPESEGWSFVARAHCDVESNVLSFQLESLPHPMAPGALHFYADNVCLESWDVVSTSEEMTLMTRHTPVTSSAILTKTEWLSERSTTHFKPGVGATILPDDAVFIAIRPRP